jgi:hypothetical protein
LPPRWTNLDLDVLQRDFGQVQPIKTRGHLMRSTVPSYASSPSHCSAARAVF